MSDNHSKEVRSYNMSKIKSKDTNPEKIVCHFLFSKGLRYRKNDKRYPGCPDIVLPKHKTIVFVHGCFWHRHPGCQYATMPSSNTDYWKEKFEKNIQRDAAEQAVLKEMGWRVIIIWECELKKDKRSRTLEKLYFDIVSSL